MMPPAATRAAARIGSKPQVLSTTVTASMPSGLRALWKSGGVESLKALTSRKSRQKAVLFFKLIAGLQPQSVAHAKGDINRFAKHPFALPGYRQNHCIKAGAEAATADGFIHGSKLKPQYHFYQTTLPLLNSQFMHIAVTGFQAVNAAHLTGALRRSHKVGLVASP